MASKEPIWETLSKMCDNIEKQLKEFEDWSHQMPAKPESWFYLNEDFLRPALLPDSNVKVVPANPSLVSVSRRDLEVAAESRSNEPEEPEQGQDSPCQFPESITEMQDKSFLALMDDPSFPDPVRKLIIDKGVQSSGTISETDIISFCQYLFNTDIHLIEITGAALFNLVIYSAITSAEKMFFSVLLLENLCKLANRFPVFMMNGVIIPLISKEDIEKQTVDVIGSMLGALSEDSLNTVFKGFLTHLKRNDEIAVKLLSVIFNKKPKLDSEMVFVLVTKLRKLSDQFSSNVLFGKLLLAIIPLLNTKLPGASLRAMREVLDHHSTFLKIPAIRLFDSHIST